MKRFLLLLLILVLAFSLVACGDKEEVDPFIGIWEAASLEAEGQNLLVNELFEGGMWIEVLEDGKWALDFPDLFNPEDVEDSDLTWENTDKGINLIADGEVFVTGVLKDGDLFLEDFIDYDFTLVKVDEKTYQTAKSERDKKDEAEDDKDETEGDTDKPSSGASDNAGLPPGDFSGSTKEFSHEGINVLYPAGFEVQEGLITGIEVSRDSSWINVYFDEDYDPVTKSIDDVKGELDYKLESGDAEIYESSYNGHPCLVLMSESETFGPEIEIHIPLEGKVLQIMASTSDFESLDELLGDQDIVAVMSNVSW